MLLQGYRQLANCSPERLMQPLKEYCRGGPILKWAGRSGKGSAPPEGCICGLINTGERLLQGLKRYFIPCKAIAGVSIPEMVASLGAGRRPAGEQEAEDGAFLRRRVESLGALDEAVAL